MTYKLKGILILSGLILAAGMIAAAAIIRFGGVSAVISETDSLQPAFVIREYNGNICVFHSEFSEVPAIVTEISMDRLGDSDKNLLEDGIKVKTREEVLMYLEDFGS